MRPVARLALVAVLLAATAGLCVHYGAAYPDGWPHPTGEQLEADYDRSVGDRVLVFGEVQAVDPAADAITIRVTTREDAVAAELAVRSVDAAVDPGGVVQVYGVLEADRTMQADETVVVTRDRSAHLYKLATSAVGGLLAVAFFLWHWRPNVARLGFAPRSPGGGPGADGPADSEVARDG